MAESAVNGDDPAVKRFRTGTERAISPSATLECVKPRMAALGITRIANLTGLDRIGIPVAAAIRPNSRSLSVSQGKGLTPEAAQASAAMEALEGFHAEHVEGPLLWGSWREMRDRHPVADVSGLPRHPGGGFREGQPVLWMVGTELLTGKDVLVPHELVHLDLRRPLPAGSGAFLTSSNGLASGNVLLEAASHAICELVERDANSLWHFGGHKSRHSTRIDLKTVDDESCRWLLDRFECAGVDVVAWDTTTDIAIPSVLCTVVDRDRGGFRAMPPVSGSGCHPRRAIALARALTEAAQGRLTIISGSRDDLSSRHFNLSQSRIEAERAGAERRHSPGKSFLEIPDVGHDTFEADVRWELERLAAAELREVVAVDLTRKEVGAAVVRVVIPHLEGMCEVSGYAPGKRARRALAEGSR